MNIAPRLAIKVQALGDFKEESTYPLEASQARAEVHLLQWASQTPAWKLYMDGSSYVEVSGVRLVLTLPDGCEPLRYALILKFKATNNEAEYETLIACLRIAKGVSVSSFEVYCDSQLVGIC